MSTKKTAADTFTVAGRQYSSRLLVGTGKYKDMDETRAAIEASYASRCPGCGNAVTVSHGNSEYSFYGHLRQGRVYVQQGQMVEQGDVIGYVGNSGLQLPAISLGLWHNFGDDTPFDIQRALVRGLFFGMITFIAFGGIVVVLWKGGLLVLEGQITAGELVSFLLYAVSVAAAITALASSVVEATSTTGPR